MKVSLFTAVYNQPVLAVRALDSVPRHPEVEVVVCDDSTDNTYEVLAQYQREHPDLNMVLMRNEQNMGAGYTINRCLDVCKGEYVYELDNDDYLYTDEFLKILPELDGTDMIYVSPRVNDGSIWRVTPQTKQIYCAGLTHLVRREFLGTNRHPTDIWCSDWHLNEALQALPHTEKFLDNIVYHYNHPREHSMIWEAAYGTIDPRFTKV